MRNPKRLAVVASIAVLTTNLCGGVALAFGGGNRWESGYFPAPSQASCVETKAPNYSYRVPVIFQDLSGDTPQLIAFGYAETCTARNDGVGQSFASIAEVEGVWRPDIEAQIAALHGTMADVAAVLPGVEHPGNNVFAFHLPMFTTSEQNRLFADPTSLGHECPSNMCPGIPASLGVWLAEGGFTLTTDSLGYRRWLIDSSRHGLDKADAAIAFFKAHEYNPIYAREAQFPVGQFYGFGGVLRVVLHPVDLELARVPAETLLVDSGRVLLAASVINHSTKPRQTEFGWRIAGESAWRTGSDLGWRPLGSNGPWLTGVDLLLLPGGALTDVELLLKGSGLVDGTVVEVAVNPHRNRPVEVVSGDDIYSDPLGNAYANNSGITKLRAPVPNLSISDIWYGPAEPTTGEPVAASVAVKNDAASSYRHPIDTVVSWSVNGEQIGQVAVDALMPGEERRVTLGAFVAPASDTALVRAEVNPDRRAPAEEGSWADNAAEQVVPVKRRALPDLSIHLNAPPEVLDSLGQFPVGVSMRNAGDQPITTTVTVELNGAPVWTKAVTIPPKGRINDRLDFRPGLAGTTMTFVGTVDPDNEVLEVDKSNNSHSTSTQILRGPGEQPPPPPGELKSWLIGG